MVGWEVKTLCHNSNTEYLTTSFNVKFHVEKLTQSCVVKFEKKCENKKIGVSSHHQVFQGVKKYADLQRISLTSNALRM